jgi:hypothetical protein
MPLRTVATSELVVPRSIPNGELVLMGCCRLTGLGNLKQGHFYSSSDASASSISCKSFSRNISGERDRWQKQNHPKHPAIRQLFIATVDVSPQPIMQMLQLVMIAALRASITASRHSICSIRNSAGIAVLLSA